MSAFYESKFKHTIVALAKKENHYETLKTYQSQNDINGLTSNSKFFAYIDSNGSGSCIGVLPHSSVGKNHVPISSPAYQQPILRAHSQSVQDIQFNPFNQQQLFSCSTDKTVKIWQIPVDGLVVDQSASAATMGLGTKSAVRGIAPHPCTLSLLAARGSREVSLVDTSTQQEILASTGALWDGDIQSMGWSFSGDVMMTTSKDKQLRLFDWRTGSTGVVAKVLAHSGLRFSRCVWLGDSPYLATVGHNAGQERELIIWDSRTMTTAGLFTDASASKSFSESPGFVKRERIDSSNGSIIPMYDADNNLLLLAGKGDTSLRMFEFVCSGDSAGVLHALSNSPIGGGTTDVTRGACLLPKQVNDFMGCEILRMLKLTDNVIQPVNISVPRIEKHRLHEDLFPPSVDEAPQSMTVEQWMAGVNEPRNRVDIAALAAASSASSSSSAVSFSGEGAVAPSSSADGEGGVVEGADVAEEGPDEDELNRQRILSKRLSSLGTNSKFRHMHGKENTKEFTYFNLSPDLSAMDSPIVACDEKFWAVPYRGGGGPVYVSKHDQFGKVEPDCATLNGHKSAVQDISFSSFHTGLMATGGGEGTVKIWDLDRTVFPESGEKVDMATVEPVQALSTHRNTIRTCTFHPTVSSLLCSTSQDLTMRFYDTEAGAEVSCIEIPQAVTINTSFNYDGTLVAVAGKDRQVRIVDPRARSVVAATSMGLNAADGMTASQKRLSTVSGGIGRNLRVLWCSSRVGVAADPIATVCSGSSGLRQLSLWDPRKLGDGPLCSKSIDNASGQLFPMFDESMKTIFLAGKGDTVLRMYELHYLEEGAAVVEAAADASVAAGIGASVATPTAAQIVEYPSDWDGFVPPVLLEKSSDFQSSREPIAGVCMLPKRCCNVANVEIARLLKLTNESLIPISFKVPRADHLKSYFHDDLYPPCRAARTLATVPDWESAESDASIFAPVLESLRPEGMEVMSERPPEPAPSQSKSKVQSFKAEIKRAEDETAQKEGNFARLQALAMQNAQYNINKSGPVKIGGVVVSHPQDDSDSSDGGWSDDD